jgi:DNA-binding transcriptional LysR family regulator
MNELHSILHGPSVEWGDVRVLLAIARSGTLGAAGRSLNLSQPTMGRRLKVLEASLGQMLFQRTADGFVLTDEGSAALVHAERMEESAHSLSRQLGSSDSRLDGVLRVSSSDWFGLHFLTPICGELTRAHPDLTIELLTDARLLSLARREADLVVRIVPFDEPDIVQRHLMHMPYALYQAKDAAPIDDASVRLVTMDTGFHDMPDAVWLRAHFPKARVAFRSNNRHVQAIACADGVGLAVLPCPLGDSHPALARVGRLQMPPGRDVWLGYHRDLRRLPRLRAFVDLLIDRVGTVQDRQPANLATDSDSR